MPGKQGVVSPALSTCLSPFAGKWKLWKKPERFEISRTEWGNAAIVWPTSRSYIGRQGGKVAGRSGFTAEQ